MKLGYGFPDNIGFSKKRPRAKSGIYNGEENLSAKALNFRLSLFYFLLIALPLILIVRLVNLQIIAGNKYRSVSDENRIRVKTLPAPRGVITDRKGELLVRNIPGYRLKVTDPGCLKDCLPYFKPISREEALQIEAKGGIEAANLEVDILREYLYPQVLAHILGYTSEISQEELKNKSGDGSYELGDNVGRFGIEKEYEETIKGVKGRQFIEVDAQEKKLGVFKEISSQPGQNLTLSIDLGLQKIAHEALGGATGVVIASDPNSGEVLALVSHPSFDPNVFSLAKNQEQITNLLTDEKTRPLFNRAIAGLYPPGSTFKIVTAAAGLETGKINAETQIEDTGEIVIGPYRFPNWYLIQYGKTEGILDIVRAIARSNDIFFYKTAEWVGEKNLGEWAKKFGLGQKLGIDLEGEGEGLIPTDAWKQENIGEKWYLGDTYHFGIGQGYLLVTPLQMNFWTSVIANGGTLYKPRLVRNTTKTRVELATLASRDKPINTNFMKKETIDLIREGMKGACATGGTGWPLFKFKVNNEKLKIDGQNFLLPEEATVSGKPDGWVQIPVACKTGTAEYGDSKGKTHAWFTAFAPVENPQIAVTVLVEGGGEGSNVAAPIAKKILEEWFGR